MNSASCARRLASLTTYASFGMCVDSTPTRHRGRTPTIFVETPASAFALAPALREAGVRDARLHHETHRDAPQAASETLTLAAHATDGTCSPNPTGPGPVRLRAVDLCGTTGAEVLQPGVQGIAQALQLSRACVVSGAPGGVAAEVRGSGVRGLVVHSRNDADQPLDDVREAGDPLLEPGAALMLIHHRAMVPARPPAEGRLARGTVRTRCAPSGPRVGSRPSESG